SILTPTSRGFLRDRRRGAGALPLRAKRNDPEEMYTYSGHPEEQIEPSEHGQQQNEQREVAVSRDINQFLETGGSTTILASHEADDHREGDDRSEHGTDAERQ